MGLDQYLEKRHYVKNWNHMQPEERHQVSVTKGGKPAGIKPERISQVTEEVGYWRKANAIHRWFVENVQKGEDDCRDYYCGYEKLVELLAAVNAALDNRKRAPAILPTQSGFFFGSTDYDEGYWSDLEDTKRMLTSLLAEDGAELGDYYYRASW